MKLVIDTNTLVSGTLWSGPSARLIEAVEQGRATLVLSAPLLAEFGDVVGRDRLASRLALQNVTPAKLVARLARQAEFVSPAPIPLPPSLRDPKDLIVLAAAVVARADIIVTGDDDLLAMKSFEGIPIMKARDAIEKWGCQPSNSFAVLREEVADVAHDFHDELFLFQDTGGELFRRQVRKQHGTQGVARRCLVRFGSR